MIATGTTNTDVSESDGPFKITTGTNTIKGAVALDNMNGNIAITGSRGGPSRPP